jgi:hypothetical protein
LDVTRRLSPITASAASVAPELRGLALRRVTDPRRNEHAWKRERERDRAEEADQACILRVRRYELRTDDRNSDREHHPDHQFHHSRRDPAELARAADRQLRDPFMDEGIIGSRPSIGGGGVSSMDI